MDRWRINVFGVKEEKTENMYNLSECDTTTRPQESDEQINRKKPKLFKVTYILFRFIFSALSL